MRAVLRIAVLLVVAILVLRTFLISGLLVPVVVAGGSMAPGLVGEHYAAICRDCGRSFACGVESAPEDLRAVCPGCGGWSDLKSIPVSSPNRLLVDRTAYLRGEPERWSMVVCPRPDEPAAWCVKRLVGMPGERMSVVDGDVYADGKIRRKDWPVLSRLAIEVDSSENRPKSGATVSHWQPTRTDSRWQMSDTGFEFKLDPHRPAADLAGGIDWLSYHHEQIIRQGNDVVRQAGPILDELAYNQNESRQLVAVPDAIFSCRLQTANDREFWLRASDGRKEFIVRLDLNNRQAVLREDDAVLGWFDLPADLDFSEPRWVHLALADCRLQLIVDDLRLIDFAYEPTDDTARQPSDTPFSIGALETLEVDQWRVARDIYYLPPPGKTEIKPRALGPNEYWLLGDNSAVSADSRTWGEQARITRDVLVGPIWRWW